MSLVDEVEAVEQDEPSRRTIARLQRQLLAAKASKDELIQAVYQAAFDAAQGLELAPVERPEIMGLWGGPLNQGPAEVAVPFVSDLQLAKVTPDYSTAVAEQRMEQYAQKIIELTRIQRTDHPVINAHVLVLGDIVEGELIFPGQSFLIDSSLYRQVTVDGPRIMVNFFRTLLTEFESIEVTWVIGNHGRIGGRASKDYDPESNADRMLGRIVETIFNAMGETRIHFNIPDGGRERNWFAIARVGRWSALCIHGDQIRGHSGFPWYGLGKKVNGWASGAIHEDFTDVAMGHWHQLALIPLNKRRVYVNGSTESYNTYAQENLAAMSDPGQWLLFVHPEKGKVTAHYPVDLG